MRWGRFCVCLSSLTRCKCSGNVGEWMDWAVASFRRNDSCLNSCTWKPGLTKARNQSFPWPDFPSPFSYKWSWFAWLTWTEDKKGTISICHTDIFSRNFYYTSGEPPIHLCELASAHTVSYFKTNNFISKHSRSRSHQIIFRHQRENYFALFTDVSVNQVERFHIAASGLSKTFHVKYETQFPEVPAQSSCIIGSNYTAFVFWNWTLFPLPLSSHIFSKQCVHTHLHKHTHTHPWINNSDSDTF